MILRLRMEMEIDTQSHSMRVIEQKVVHGMPTALIDPKVVRTCAGPGCTALVGVRANGVLAKFCGRGCFGKSRRNPQFIERHTPGRQVIIDAVSGVVTPALPPPRVIREEIVSTAAAPNYSTFSFPS